MGRQSGFIAMQVLFLGLTGQAALDHRYDLVMTAAASLASGLADICLIPEEPFDLEGEHGLLAYIEQVRKLSTWLALVRIWGFYSLIQLTSNA
eukprot:1160871-Pelagomonas_calceolata.AAC.12